MDVETDDLPQGFSSSWSSMVERLKSREWVSFQLWHYRQHRDAINAHRRKTRASRAKPRAQRLYAGVPVVVRRALREHIAQIRAAQRAAK